MMFWKMSTSTKSGRTCGEDVLGICLLLASRSMVHLGRQALTGSDRLWQALTGSGDTFVVVAVTSRQNMTRSTRDTLHTLDTTFEWRHPRHWLGSARRGRCWRRVSGDARLCMCSACPLYVLFPCLCVLKTANICVNGRLKVPSVEINKRHLGILQNNDLKQIAITC
jgi:hypothetical protein